MDIEAIIRQMTLEGKIALCSGASFWQTKKFEPYGIPLLFMCDAPPRAAQAGWRRGHAGRERIRQRDLLPGGGDYRRQLGSRAA